MNLLVLKKFNNYFNRIIKKYSDLDDYIAAAASFKRVADFNFNPNDGVRTEVVLGKGDLSDFFDFEKTNSADYLVAYKTVTENDETFDVIDSRWFITEVKRTRAGQYLIQLKRDTIADYFNSLISCPAYIQKGICADDNPLILNDEGIRVNQIKTSETLLKDNTGSAWIVGYLSKDFKNQEHEEDPISVQIPAGDYDSITIENLALELGVPVGALENLLVTDPANEARFVNDSVELVTWINIPDNQDIEQKVLAGSTNNLQSFTYARQEQPTMNDYNKCSMKWGPDSVFQNPFTWNAACWQARNVTSYWKNAVNSHAAQIKNNWSSFTHHPFLPRKVYDKLVYLQKNHILIYKAGLYYQVIVGDGNVENTKELYPVGQNDPVMSSIINDTISAWNNSGDGSWIKLSARSTGKVFINYNELTANVHLTNKLVDASVPTASVDISTSRNGVLDQPFDMFAIPCTDTVIKDGVNNYDVNGDYAKKLAIALMAEKTSGQIYDLQLLPYCPMIDIIGNGKIDITSKQEHYDYDWVTFSGTDTVREEHIATATAYEYEPGNWEGTAGWTSTITYADVIDWGYEVGCDQGFEEEMEAWEHGLTAAMTNSGGKASFSFYNQISDAQAFEHAGIYVKIWVSYEKSLVDEKKSIIIYPKTNSFSITLNYSLSLKESMKMDSQCDLYRLVSPNYQGSFDFNVAKNGGQVRSFIADCTYKPYTPYIKIAPEFGWMYGTNFGDARGLICSGDFSVGFYTDKWQEYQLNNKNYQNIFNRDIQNLSVNQSIQREQAWATGIFGIMNSAGQGAAAGAMAGGGYGAAAGAALGAGLSAGGMAKDIQLMEKSMVEQRQYAIDKFNMQVENIQALPYTLTKVDAFNINSKIWPFLEYYTCTDKEKDYLRNKFKYEGYTIGAVDDLGQFMHEDCYVQAYLIRNTEITDDPHQLDDINNELLKGVYL